MSNNHRNCFICGMSIKPKDKVIVIDKGYHDIHFRYTKRIIGETHICCFEDYFGLQVSELLKRERSRRMISRL